MTGNTPLLEAVVCQHADKVRVMIERGGDVNIANNGGDTGLHMAALSGNAEILKVYYIHAIVRVYDQHVAHVTDN